MVRGRGRALYPVRLGLQSLARGLGLRYGPRLGVTPGTSGRDWRISGQDGGAHQSQVRATLPLVAAATRGPGKVRPGEVRSAPLWLPSLERKEEICC